MAVHAPIIRSSLPAFSFHRADLIMVDEAALALRCLRIQGFCDDGFDRIGVGFDCRGQRIIAERAEANFAHLDFFAVLGCSRSSSCISSWPLRTIVGLSAAKYSGTTSSFSRRM